MNSFEQLITSIAAEPEIVLHLGVGSCKEYEIYQDMQAERYIFVEPQPQPAQNPINKFESSAKVELISKAIASKRGRQVLKLTSSPSLRRPLSPAKLLDYYHDIFGSGEIEVDTITLEQLCTQEDIDDTTDNLLVADLQGLDEDIFPTLAVSTLNKFKWIIIRTTTLLIHQPVINDTRETLLDAIRNAGYMVLVFTEETTSSVNILCVKNQAELESVHLKEQLSGLESTIINLEQDLHIKTKLLLKADVDSKDLQRQYKTALHHQDQQHHLLCELKGKLTQAATLYHQLNLQDIELGVDTLLPESPDTVPSLKRENTDE